MLLSIKNFRSVLFASVLIVGVAVSAQAQDSIEDKLPEGTQIQKVENPEMEEVRELAVKLAENLGEAEINNLAMVRDGFGMIRSAEIAQDTVEDAIEECIDANPDIADSLEERHDVWDEAVGDALKIQKKKMDAAISKDYFNNPDDIEDYLDAIDDAAEYAESNIKKEIITSESACINLRDSMDNTQETITKMLSDIPWPETVLSEDNKG